MICVFWYYFIDVYLGAVVVVFLMLLMTTERTIQPEHRDFFKIMFYFVSGIFILVFFLGVDYILLNLNLNEWHFLYR